MLKKVATMLLGTTLMILGGEYLVRVHEPFSAQTTVVATLAVIAGYLVFAVSAISMVWLGNHIPAKAG